VRAISNNQGKFLQDLVSNTLSVEEVLNNVNFEGYQLIAGKGGLNNRCRHMIILETPEGIEWLQGGEFLLTSGFAFKDNPEAWKTVIVRAHKMGIAAIAIKEKRYLLKIPQEMIDQADKYNIPVILLPIDSIYTDKIASFYEALFYIKNEYLVQAKNMDERLLNLVFDKNKADEVIVGISGLTNVSIVIYDEAFFEISSCLVNEKHKLVFESAEYKDLLNTKRKFGKCYRLEIDDNTYFAKYFLMPSDGVASYMCVASDMEIGILQEKALQYGSMIFSLKEKKEERQSLKEIKLKRSLTELILNNANLGEDFYNSIEYDYSWNSKKGAIGLVITSEDIRKFSVNKDVQKMKQYIYRVINRIFEKIEYLITERKNSIIVFFGIDNIEDMDRLLKTIKLYLKKNYNKNIRITFGISRMYESIRDVLEMYNDCMITRMFDKKYEITYYDSLDTVKLVYPLKDDKQFMEYYKKTIDVLSDYDKKYGRELIKTLKYYFDYNMNMKDTADSLFIHVETLRYRLNKIEQLTGYTLDTSDGLLILQLTIKLHFIIGDNE